MRNKIFRNLLYLAIISSTLTFIAMSVFMYARFYDQMKATLRSEATYIAVALNIDEETYLEKIDDHSATNRITIIDVDGKVLFDSASDYRTMENHLNRPEVQSAIKTGYGEATRYSSTINQQTFYYALMLDNGHVLRVASITSSVITTLISGIPFLTLLMGFMLFVTIYVSSRQTDSLVAPINAINLDSPLANETYEDLSPLLIRLDEQNRSNEKQMQLLNEQNIEFNSIINNMQEGLLVIGKNGNIMSINNSAAKIFEIDQSLALNKNYMTLNRSDAFISTINQALSNEVIDTLYQAHGRLYQIIASPINNDTNKAAVILLMDITEKHERENLRKEFSANVSHELKTPLTSIIGYADIIENGIAKSEDIPKFASNINTEAQNLLDLIDDIIKLSRLDEKEVNLAFESINLKTVSEDVIKSLKTKADENNITIKLVGKDLYINGVRNIIYEMVYNLCDNAIKYNKQNGSVTITLKQTDKNALLTITDTGIGIAKEHQQRIFERFYRVDKSHSRLTGGTGLGLAIVKNGAKFHNATIDLESIEDKGTTFTIKFPS
ncbi:MAG: ATP-binding protein [Erysipelotrichaceae bacterium]|nr:ATP-binding protein [Erysipelotrichaceae bacterium]